MKIEKVAIIKDGKDIGRIIPFNKNEADADFKISFSKNNYSVNMFSFLSTSPELLNLENMTEWEISYHRRTVLKPTVIHLKEKKNQPEYKVLPLKRIIDPSIHHEFPIPFMRIQIPISFQAKDYKEKRSKKPVVVDMGEANVAEFYLTNTSFDYEAFSMKWPAISFRLLTSSFEYFATNNMTTDENKYKYFLPSGDDIRTAAMEIDINQDMKFYINMYKNPDLIDGDMKVTFIENEFAHALLGLSPIGYENAQGKVEMRPGFEEDLNRDTMPFEEKQKWRYRFKRMQDKLEQEMKRIQKSKRR
ncbi:hypothetical protein [Bacillus massilinigeriensis]|uniref:hypothetical protein n=1 Tax=Bacillus massilionigeriensis TaxID=1805475 RepID=UPI00096B0347|nr:hypothetical protein [Bacillus massilionigeriensis]